MTITELLPLIEETMWGYDEKTPEFQILYEALGKLQTIRFSPAEGKGEI